MATNLDSSVVANGDIITAAQRNALRKDLIKNAGDFEVAGGTGDVLTLAIDTAYIAYASGDVVKFKASAANTGAVTINVNSIGVVSILRIDGNELIGGDLVSGAVYSVLCDGTNFRLQSQPNAFSSDYLFELDEDLSKTDPMCLNSSGNIDALKYSDIDDFVTGADLDGTGNSVNKTIKGDKVAGENVFATIITNYAQVSIRVHERNPDTGVITSGTATLITAAPTTGDCDVTYIADYRIFVCYVDDDDDLIGKIYSVDPTTLALTLEDTETIYTDGTIIVNNCASCLHSADTIAISFVLDDDDVELAAINTTSDTFANLNVHHILTVNGFGTSGALGGCNTDICSINATGVMQVFTAEADGGQRFMYSTISGTTVTERGQLLTLNGNQTRGHHIKKATDGAVISSAFNDTNNYSYVHYVYLSGSTPTYGGIQRVVGADTSIFASAIAVLSATRYLVAFTYNDDRTYVYEFLLDGYVPVCQQHKPISMTQGDRSLESAFILFRDESDADGFLAIAIFRLAAQATAYTFTEFTNFDKVIGLANNDETSGNNALSRRTGILSGFTGMTPAEMYYLQRDGTFDRTSSPYRVGMAKSATEQLLEFTRIEHVSITNHKVSDTAFTGFLFKFYHKLGFKPRQITVYIISNDGADNLISDGEWVDMQSESDATCVYSKQSDNSHDERNEIGYGQISGDIAGSFDDFSITLDLVSFASSQYFTIKIVAYA